METTISPSAASAVALQCPSCRADLNVNREAQLIDESCPVCRRELSITTYPRLFRAPVSEPDGAPVGEGEAACTFFPNLRADQICDACGSFLSSKATVKWGEKALCLPCLHRLREEEQPSDFIARTNLHDNRALALVTWLAPFSLFTAPIALYLLLRHRDTSRGFVPRSRGRWWTAMALSLLLLVGWIVLLVIWISLIVADFN